jgi:hypothetical protein
MAIGIKYSDTNITGAIRTGNVALAVQPGEYGPTSSTGWYSAFSPESGKYIVYETSVSSPPKLYAPKDDTEMILLANSKGAGATTIDQALSYFITQSGSMVANNDYPNIITDGLSLNLDVTSVASYPNGSSVWYDLSGNANNATYRNNTYFTTLSGRRAFRLANNAKYVYSSPTDGFNQISNPGLLASVSSFTFESWFYTSSMDTGQTVILSNAGSANGYRWGPQATATYWLMGNGNPYNEGTVGSYTSVIGRWVHMVGIFDRANDLGGGVKFYTYINASLEGSNTIYPSDGMQTSGPMMPGNCCGAFDGYLSVVRVYTKALTQSEITTNFNAQKAYFGL